MMVQSTRLFGVVLVTVGVGAYLVTGGESVTALLPAFLGLPIFVLGLVAGGPDRRRGALITAWVLALLGAVGTAMNVVELPALLTGGDVERPTAVAVSTITALLCLVYLVVAGRWLFAGRRGDGGGA
jgi:hypothetical protein